MTCHVTIIIPGYVVFPTFSQCQKALKTKLPLFVFSDIERKESLDETKKEVGVSSTDTKPQNQTHEDKAHPKSQQGKNFEILY